MNFFLFFFFFSLCIGKQVANLIVVDVEYIRPTGEMVSAKCSWKFGRDMALIIIVVVVIIVMGRRMFKDKWKSATSGRTRQKFRRMIVTGLRVISG